MSKPDPIRVRCDTPQIDVRAGGSVNPNKAPKSPPPITNTRPQPTENKKK